MAEKTVGATIFRKAVNIFETAFRQHIPAGSFPYPASEFHFLQNLHTLTGQKRAHTNCNAFSTEIWAGLLFDFLQETLPDLMPDASRVGFPEEPENATTETKAENFWLLAALIEDVWEHCTSDTLQARDSYYLETIKSLPVNRIYDFGGGAGRFALELACHGLQVHYADTNTVKRRFLRYCRDKLALNLLSTQGSPANRFDLILAIDVLDHLPDPAHHLGLLRKRLRDGGFLLFDASFNDDGWHMGGKNHVDLFFTQLAQMFQLACWGKPDFCGSLCVAKPHKPAGYGNTWADQSALYMPEHVQTLPMEGTAGYIVAANTKVVEPFVVSPLARDFIEAFRTPIQTDTITDLAADLSLDAQTGQALVEDLFKRRVLGGYQTAGNLKMLELYS